MERRFEERLTQLRDAAEATKRTPWTRPSTNCSATRHGRDVSRFTDQAYLRHALAIMGSNLLSREQLDALATLPLEELGSSQRLR